MALYKIYNGPAPTTAAQAKQATGTAIRTMLQFQASATIGARIKEWGWSGDGSAAATPGIVELFETTVAATGMTALAAADIVKYDAAALMGGNPTTNLIQVGTGATAYAPGAAVTEGTPANVRMLDAQLIAPTSQYVIQIPEGKEGFIQPGNFCRIRCTFGASINAICYILVEI
jgi:hypothetical protein